MFQHSQIDDLRKELTRSETRIEQLTAELETSRRESGDWQLELERLRVEFKESSEKTFKVQAEVRCSGLHPNLYWTRTAYHSYLFYGSSVCTLHLFYPGS